MIDDVGCSGRHQCPQCAQCRIYASVNWVTISSGTGLSPVRHQAITWTSAGLLSFEPLGIKFSDIRIAVLTFLFKKMCFSKMLSAKVSAILSRRRWVKMNMLRIKSLFGVRLVQLWFGDATQRHCFLLMFQVMAFCLRAPSNVRK